jgi:hypothetical protein
MYRASLGTRGETRRQAAEAETALIGRVRKWTRAPPAPARLAPHVRVSSWVRAPEAPPSPPRRSVPDEAEADKDDEMNDTVERVGEGEPMDSVTLAAQPDGVGEIAPAAGRKTAADDDTSMAPSNTANAASESAPALAPGLALMSGPTVLSPDAGADAPGMLVGSLDDCETTATDALDASSILARVSAPVKALNAIPSPGVNVAVDPSAPSDPNASLEPISQRKPVAPLRPSVESVPISPKKSVRPIGQDASTEPAEPALNALILSRDMQVPVSAPDIDEPRDGGNTEPFACQTNLPAEQPDAQPKEMISEQVNFAHSSDATNAFENATGGRENEQSAPMEDAAAALNALMPQNPVDVTTLGSLLGFQSADGQEENFEFRNMPASAVPPMISDEFDLASTTVDAQGGSVGHKVLRNAPSDTPESSDFAPDDIPLQTPTGQISANEKPSIAENISSAYHRPQ